MQRGELPVAGRAQHQHVARHGGMRELDVRRRREKTPLVFPAARWRRDISLKPMNRPLVCASASAMSTPGMMGRPGKCPANCGSSGRSVRSATMNLSGSSFVTRSTNRNGGRCGSTGRRSSNSNNGLSVMVQVDLISQIVPASSCFNSWAMRRWMRSHNASASSSARGISGSRNRMR